MELRSRVNASPAHSRYLLIGALLSILLGVLSAGPTTASVILIAAVLFIGIAGMSSRFLLSILLLLLFVDRSPLQFHGSYLRFYMLPAVAFIIRQAWQLASSKERRPPYLGYMWLWIGAYIPSIILRPVIPGTNPAQPVPFTDWAQVVFGEVFLVLLCGSIHAYVARLGDVERRRLQWNLWRGGVLVVVSGFVQLAIALARGHALRPYGLMREPDWYGTVCAIIAVLSAAWQARGTYRSQWLVPVYWMSFGGMVLSLSRASYLQWFVGMLYLWRQRRHKNTNLKPLLVTAYVLAACVIIAVCAYSLSGSVPSFLPPLLSRLDPHTTLVAASNAGLSHLYAIRLMAYLIHQRPLSGWGPGVMAIAAWVPAFRLAFAGGGVINAGRGSANLFFNEATEAGLVGLVLMLAWMRKIRQSVDKANPLWWVLVGLLVDFQFSNGIDFGFPWVILGLLSGITTAEHMDNRPNQV